MQPIIRVENLGKRYRLGAASSGYSTLRESITDLVTAPLSRLRRKPASEADAIWALKGVGFEVMPGEIVGIIGRNGAGKSTLLKILSRITHPTTGRVELHGRVGSLLEVGTGFHPELTGRENIYLNGAILGMRRDEVRRRFDEIVDFSGNKRFLDTQVKYYSSGMYLRLAFAVAVHLDPEILIVDEVLAVGDAQFQQKCIAKMREIGQSGRTILFVSHNLAALRTICSRGLLIDGGTTVCDGEMDSIADRYLALTMRDSATNETYHTQSYDVEDICVRSVNAGPIKTFDRVVVEVRVKARVDIVEPGLYVAVLGMSGERLAALDYRDFVSPDHMQVGEVRVMGFIIDDFPLMPGQYQLEVYVKDLVADKIELVPQRIMFEVADSVVYGGRQVDHWFGTVALAARPITEDLLPRSLVQVEDELSSTG